MPRVYGSTLCPFSRAVHMLCEALNVRIEKQNVDWLHQETADLCFKSLNPNEEVPVFQDDDGFVVYESAAIMLFLCESFDTERKWLPRPLRERTAVHQVLHWVQRTLKPSIHEIVYHSFFALQYLDIKHSDDDQKVRNGFALLNTALKTLNDRLETSKYLCGNVFPTIADISVVCLLSQLCLVQWRVPALYPHVDRWLTLMQSLPAWGVTHSYLADTLQRMARNKRRLLNTELDMIREEELRLDRLARSEELRVKIASGIEAARIRKEEEDERARQRKLRNAEMQRLHAEEESRAQLARRNEAARVIQKFYMEFRQRNPRHSNNNNIIGDSNNTGGGKAGGGGELSGGLDDGVSPFDSASLGTGVVGDDGTRPSTGTKATTNPDHDRDKESVSTSNYDENDSNYNTDG
eukprot:gnl/Spiro4/9431_TR4988_c0_g1_i1.p1 gnl/Spiro4/9431_TR4988_c0_g1~~gnl/Spiro4/9431_TR4988_c0_g1_i1.p1  ORF type:complete len:440 (+),score=168.59 gnl/Spiro4/9431_TR4988_c0_g1_i1:99-1322(+)